MYVKRDSQGRISAVSADAAEGFDEQLNNTAPALNAFMQAHADAGSAASTGLGEKAQLLQQSDTELARVLEDIIDLLTAKGVIQFTELPRAAQEKLLARKGLRQRIRKLDLVGDEDEEEDEDMLP